MEQAIKDFAKQFEFQPEIINEEKLVNKKSYIVSGMGGSHLAADILKNLAPQLDIVIHSDYGFPDIPEDKLADYLFIASSYSGNTEEPLEGLDQAMAKGMAIAVIAVGGQMLEIAKEKGLPYIQMPDTGIQPRSALGFSYLSLLKIMNQGKMIEQAAKLADILKPEALEKQGQELADILKDKVPVIYTSRANFSIAYNWKIKLNETGKIPAFYNILPELNHNEMNGFDVTNTSRHLSDNFHFVFIKDQTDHPQIIKRMQVIKELYLDRGLPVLELELVGDTKPEQIFNSLILADWTAVYTAGNYGLEAEQVPMVEEFKKLIKN